MVTTYHPQISRFGSLFPSTLHAAPREDNDCCHVNCRFATCELIVAAAEEFIPSEAAAAAAAA